MLVLQIALGVVIGGLVLLNLEKVLALGLWVILIGLIGIGIAFFGFILLVSLGDVGIAAGAVILVALLILAFIRARELKNPTK